MSSAIAPLPVTKVPDDGPYHEHYPENVKVSEFVNSRCIEPFYDVLEELVAAGAKINIEEYDQDVGGPVGPKGWFGCTGDNDCGSVTGATGSIDYPRSHTNVIPPKHQRTIYGLEELRIRVSFASGSPVKCEESQLKITPVLPTLFMISELNGKVVEAFERKRSAVTIFKLVLPKPLSYEVLRAYQTQSEFSNWTITDLFNRKWEEARGMLGVYNAYGDAIIYDDYDIALELDKDLFETVECDIEHEIAKVTQDRHLLKKIKRSTSVETEIMTYHYICIMQATDLRNNKDVLLGWIRNKTAVKSE